MSSTKAERRALQDAQVRHCTLACDCNQHTGAVEKDAEAQCTERYWMEQDESPAITYVRTSPVQHLTNAEHAEKPESCIADE